MSQIHDLEIQHGKGLWKHELSIGSEFGTISLIQYHSDLHDFNVNSSGYGSIPIDTFLMGYSHP